MNQPHPSDPVFSNSEETPEPLEIDWSMLEGETLERVARETLLREWGNDDNCCQNLEEAAHDLVRRIKRGEYRVTFDPVTESVGLNSSSY